MKKKYTKRHTNRHKNKTKKYKNKRLYKNRQNIIKSFKSNKPSIFSVPNKIQSNKIYTITTKNISGNIIPGLRDYLI